MNNVVDRLKGALAHPQPTLAETLLADLTAQPLADLLDQTLVVDRLELAIWEKRWHRDPDLEVVGASIYRFLLRKRLGLTMGIEEIEQVAKDVAKRAREAMGEGPGTPFLPPSTQQLAIASELRHICRLEGWEAGWTLYREDGSDPECWRKLLHRAGAALIDLGLHAGNLRAAEAAQAYVDRLNMPLDVARQEVAHHQAHPTVAATPLLVYLLLLELRAQQQQDPAFDRRAFDARILAAGPIPVPRLAEVLSRP